ncbi:MAG: alpha/beta hydrolase [Pyrinomonadaceae bacterium]|nr:alpha/beta hydrolase [Pyrinomonadaceae bacterium]
MPEYLINKPPGRPVAHFVFAHGAGAPMDHAFMNSIAEGIASQGIRVTRFEFPYMAKRRITGKRGGPGSPKVLLQTWREVVAELNGEIPLFIGGKSMGGRIATMVADEQGLEGIVCFGYPFHPPGRSEKLRTEHLASMPLPMLVIQGERDTFGNKEEVGDYDLAETIEFEWMPDGDHSLKPRKKSGFTEEENLEAAVQAAAAFIKKNLPGR